MAKIDDILKDLEHNTITFNAPLISNPKATVTFRPLKTKDQKILIIDKEEVDNDEIKNFDAIIKLLDAVITKCPVALGDLEIADFVWILLNIRAKSIGETLELVATCKNPECKKKNDLNFDIFKDSIKEEIKEKHKIIKVNDNINVTLGILTLNDFRDILEYTPEDRPIAILAATIKSVEFMGEVVDLELISKIAIVSEFTKEVNDQISKFAEFSTKGIRLQKNIKCTCGTESTYGFDTLEIIRFF